QEVRGLRRRASRAESHHVDRSRVFTPKPVIAVQSNQTAGLVDVCDAKFPRRSWDICIEHTVELPRLKQMRRQQVGKQSVPISDGRREIDGDDTSTCRNTNGRNRTLWC